MRRPEDAPLPPEIAQYLDVVDATLAGEPVDPRHAELAELALLIADERPRPSASFSPELDERVSSRFGAAAKTASQRPGSPARRRPPAWAAKAGMAGAALAGVLVLVVAVVVVAGVGGGGGASSSSEIRSDVAVRRPSAPSRTTPANTSASVGTSAAASGSAAGSASTPASPSSAASSSAGTGAGSQLSLPPNGRRVVQSAELDLGAAPDRIDVVAQEVLKVVGTAAGIVDHSTVTQTGGLDGSASFQLRVPSGALGEMMARLSALPNARVLARTDNSADVNDRYLSVTRALADAQALRNALLGRLAVASTAAEIDGLKAQLKRAEASIASDQASLRGLNSQINFSRVTVTINPRSTPTPVSHGQGFTFGGAAHMAGRILVVAAGATVIGLAVLLPISLVAALLGWIGLSVRRRRREQALDLA